MTMMVMVVVVDVLLAISRPFDSSGFACFSCHVRIKKLG
jgi:hypothetical protein